MPISTPDFLVESYYGDKDHFLHVLEHIHIPAVKAAGLTPIPAIAEGSDIIHAEIIKNLESADLVLCDMSALNANVFFELGIRTAVNRPIALVKDDLTPRVPFDTNIINNHTYLSSLTPWSLDAEINKLKLHLQQCVEKAKHGNTLWRYFSLSQTARPMEEKSGVDSQLQFMNLQVEALRTELRETMREKKVQEDPSPKPQNEGFFSPFLQMARAAGNPIISGSHSGDKLQLHFSEKPSSELHDQIASLAHKLDLVLNITDGKKPPATTPHPRAPRKKK